MSFFRDLLAMVDEYLPWIPNWLWAASMLVTGVEHVFLWFRPDGRLTIAQVADEYARLALRMVEAPVAH